MNISANPVSPPRRVTVGARLGAAFTLVVAIFLVVIAVTAWKIETVSRLTRNMANGSDLLMLADRWLADVRQNSARSLAVAAADGTQILSLFADSMKATSLSTDATQKAFLAQVRSPETLALAQRVGVVRKEFLAVRDQVNQLKAAGNDTGAQALVRSSFVPLMERYIAAAQALVDHQTEELHQLQQKVEESFALLYKLLIGLASAGVIAAALTCWSFVYRLRRNLMQAVGAARRIGAGDLRHTLHSQGNDEIGDLMNALQSAQVSLKDVVRQVQAGVNSITTASHEIAAGNNDLSSRTEQTAANLQQTAASMEQLTGTVAQSADSALQAHRLAQAAADSARQGGELVSQVVSTMNQINNNSKQIADIIGVIDSIAFQTNVLALNAAVEAARAGEQGRGFAVVAAEVRSLASRSAAAAKEIKQLIGASVERIDAGSLLVADAGRAMAGIVDSVQRVSAVIGEVTSASAEQRDGIGQVNDAVVQLDQMTQQNAALVEESAAAAESLRLQARQLVGSVAVFKLA